MDNKKETEEKEIVPWYEAYQNGQLKSFPAEFEEGELYKFEDESSVGVYKIKGKDDFGIIFHKNTLDNKTSELVFALEGRKAEALMILLIRAIDKLNEKKKDV